LPFSLENNSFCLITLLNLASFHKSTPSIQQVLFTQKMSIVKKTKNTALIYACNSSS